MGNRAVITTEKKDLGVYLHWNGGRDSVEAFLLFCKLKGYRPPEQDCYGWARLAQTIANCFPDGLSVGLNFLARLDCDNHDNGLYIIRNWEIVGREFQHYREQNNNPIECTMDWINSQQPEEVRLSKEQLDAAITNYLNQKGKK